MGKRQQEVFFILDTSGSMTGERIAVLNAAMEEFVYTLKEIAAKEQNIQFKIAILEFNSGCRWVTPDGPVAIEDYLYEDLNAGGLSSFGAALLELNAKMTRQAFLGSSVAHYLPVVIFMTDGFSTDDYERPLEQIWSNQWFARAMKLGFGIGDADYSMLAKTVGSREAVFRTFDFNQLKPLFHHISIGLPLVQMEIIKTGPDFAREIRKKCDVQEENFFLEGDISEEDYSFLSENKDSLPLDDMLDW